MVDIEEKNTDQEFLYPFPWRVREARLLFT